ncbi:RING-H2 finger protein ATL56-like protein [Tanacetum coccineum]
MFLILSFSLIFIGLAAILLLLAATFLHRRRHATAIPPPLHHLPSFQYYSQNDISHDCSICLEGFKERDMCRAMQVCDHFFHAKCVDTWLVKVPSCPICRRVVRLEDDRMCGDDDECRFLWAIGVGRQLLDLEALTSYSDAIDVEDQQMIFQQLTCLL